MVVLSYPVLLTNTSNRSHLIGTALLMYLTYLLLALLVLLRRIPFFARNKKFPGLITTGTPLRTGHALPSQGVCLKQHLRAILRLIVASIYGSIQLCGVGGHYHHHHRPQLSLRPPTAAKIILIYNQPTIHTEERENAQASDATGAGLDPYYYYYILAVVIREYLGSRTE